MYGNRSPSTCRRRSQICPAKAEDGSASGGRRKIAEFIPPGVGEERQRETAEVHGENMMLAVDESEIALNSIRAALRGALTATKQWKQVKIGIQYI